MQRRIFLTLLGGAAAAWPLAARAQQPAKIARIGILTQGSSPGAGFQHNFRDALRELGYIEGQNLTIESRYAAGRLDALYPLAQELVGLNVDVIATGATPAAKAAQRATGTVPIVIIDPGDPVETGLVASLARPGANITGQTSIAPDLAGKRLQLLKKIAPSVSRVAVLWNSAIPPAEVALKELRFAATTLKVEMLSVEVRGEQDFESTFATMTQQRADGLLVFHDPLMGDNAKLIVDTAAKNRLAAMYWLRSYVGIGGLMSYGPNYLDMFYRAGNYVGRILKGAKPADLPVEQPDRFYLVINLKTAEALGLDVPSSLQQLADEVIE
jgi:putative tryptophan/tyrosine transport system substrate-binding protein